MLLFKLDEFLHKEPNYYLLKLFFLILIVNKTSRLLDTTYSNNTTRIRIHTYTQQSPKGLKALPDFNK